MTYKYKGYTNKHCFSSFKGTDMQIKKKHGCQNLVAMETSSHVINKLSYEIVAR